MAGAPCRSDLIIPFFRSDKQSPRTQISFFIGVFLIGKPQTLICFWQIDLETSLFFSWFGCFHFRYERYAQRQTDLYCGWKNKGGNPPLWSTTVSGGGTRYERGGDAVVSLRGVNFGFWSHLGCCGQNAIIFSREGLVYGCTRKNIKIYIWCVCFLVSFRGQKSLCHSQIGLL